MLKINNKEELKQLVKDGDTLVFIHEGCTANEYRERKFYFDSDELLDFHEFFESWLLINMAYWQYSGVSFEECCEYMEQTKQAMEEDDVYTFFNYMLETSNEEIELYKEED